MVTLNALLVLVLSLAALFSPSEAFIIRPRARAVITVVPFSTEKVCCNSRDLIVGSRLNLVTETDLTTVALVTGQETYGFAIVVLGEALWSFFLAPSFSHAKILIPASIAAVLLIAVSGPLVTSGDARSITLGLEIAMLISVLLGASYIVRLLAPYSPSPKEIAFVGLLVALAGFFSFSQNLVVDEFVQLPALPSIPFPQIPLGLGESIDTSF